MKNMFFKDYKFYHTAMTNVFPLFFCFGKFSMLTMIQSIQVLTTTNKKVTNAIINGKVLIGEYIKQTGRNMFKSFLFFVSFEFGDDNIL